jgi:hypothetical protein
MTAMITQISATSATWPPVTGAAAAGRSEKPPVDLGTDALDEALGHRVVVARAELGARDGSGDYLVT